MAKKSTRKEVPSKQTATKGAQTKRLRKSAGGSSSEVPTTKPRFPYSTKPNALRKFLELVPRKPKPEKINLTLIKSWGFRDSNDATIIRVLKAIGFVDQSNLPTADYVAFMSPGTGPAVLGRAIRNVYEPLFQASHEPHKEPHEILQNYFNIHSGGSEKTLSHQIQTFKALCDNAAFGSVGDGATPAALGVGVSNTAGERVRIRDLGGGASPVAIHVNLHIHLPENKDRRDYEYILEDIGKYLMGRGESSADE